jgi:serine/threonine protein phosphatase PrpC
VEAAVLVEAAGDAGQDRAAVFDFAGGKLVVIADGAGGISGGAEAAQAVVDRVRELTPTPELDWVGILRVLDAELSAMPKCGETTAVLVFMTEDTIVGASVGDCGAWMLAFGAWLDLLEDQRRKPLLGSGAAVPVGFGPHPMGDRVIIGTDGLFKYVDSPRIGALASLDPLDLAVEKLVDAARLGSGELQDDIAVVLAG